MLVPRSHAEYAVYARSRQNLAIARGDLLRITATNPDGGRYGVHPAMSGIKDLFDRGSAAFVTNVGPLIEPVDKASYFNGSAMLPPRLFAHNEQQDQWNALQCSAQSRTGWAGRMAELIRAGVAGQRRVTKASPPGSKLLQRTDETAVFVTGPGGPVRFDGFSIEPDGILCEQREAILRVRAEEHRGVSAHASAREQERTNDAVATGCAAVDTAPALSTVFPPSRLGAELETVARLIAVRDDLAMQRQVFFVAAGGFDTHDNQNEDQPGLLGGISDAISAFYAATIELGIAEQVTTFTQSDFGRTLTSNGSGTDHAWGGNQIVVGGSVLGGELYGRYPLLEIGGDEDVGGGRIIPSTSADQYAATLASWFGVPDAELDLVAPHIANFNSRNLGFLA